MIGLQLAGKPQGHVNERALYRLYRNQCFIFNSSLTLNMFFLVLLEE